MGKFKSQLKTLLKKNLLLKSKSKVGICNEILLPIIIVLIIFAILILVQAFQPNYDIENVNLFPILINKDYKIIYGSNNGSLNIEQKGVMNVMKLQLSETLGLNLTDIENDYFLEINNKELMEIYFLNNSNNVFGGIWFDDDDGSNSDKSFKYNIRLDSDNVLNNEKVIIKKSDSRDYLKKNFGFIQVAMDQAIFRYYNLTTKLMIFGQRYPDPWTKLYQKFINGREAVFKSSGSVFITAGLMIFSFRLVTELVVEKETKIREGMKMMGLNDFAYFLSWIITSLIIGLPIDLVIVIILKGSQVIYSTSWGIVIAIMVLYLLTLLLLAFIFSMFFDKSKFAGLITFLLVLVINICGIFIGKSEFSIHIKLFLCLLSPVAFASSIYTMAIKDLKEILTVNMKYLLSEEQVIGMLVFDIIFYTFLIWYLDKIVKTEFGTKEPWYFLFTKKYWYNGKKARDQSEYMDGGNDIESTHRNQDVEMIPMDIRNKTTISIRNLRKEYNTGDGLRVAVDDLYLDMFDGQIHGFLGPNGSGKSTTIGMLTGLIQPTSGTAFIQGNDITYQMSKIRNQTGVCLQTDIIWPQLTVLEHLMIYASLKGITNSKEIKKEAKKMAIEVDLAEKLNAPAGSLSGGQKRKLCLGIAFIGKSNIIFLDEISSGMDPLSRRVVWDFLLKYKKGRTIILTTHYLEEADYLCDRVSIISFGKLITDGSSLYLKNKYGVGYLLTCSKYLSSIESLFNVDQVTEFIKQYIPDAEILSNAGTEISYRLPKSSLPKFAEFFSEFDSKLESFHIETYGISVTTLEEVFLKIGTDSSSTTTSIIDDGSQESEELKHSIAISSSGINSKQQFKGLLIKRIKTSSKDMKSFLLSLLLPIIVIIGSIIVYKEVDSPIVFYNNSTKPLIMSLNQYGSNDKVPIQMMDGSSSSSDLFSSSPYFNQMIFINENINYKQYLIDNYKESTGAIVFKSPIIINSPIISYNVLFNFDYIHSWPIHVNLINDALLRNHTNGEIGIQVTSMPFNHILSDFEIANSNLNIQSIVYFVIIMLAGFSLMAGSFGGNISQERTNRIKRLLYISGCKKYIYWLSNLIWDYFFSFIILSITTIVIAIVDDKFRNEIGIFILSLSLFSLAIVPLSYLLSYKFTSFGKSTGAITCIHFAIGVVLTIIMINLRIQIVIKRLQSLQDASDIVDIVFNIISPFYAFSRILFIITNFPGALRLGSFKIDNPWSMNYGGIPLIILGCHVLVWSVWILLLDYTPEFKGYLKNPKTIPAPLPPPDEDSDVTAERIRIENLSEAASTEQVLQFKGLHKLFVGKGKNPDKIAVYNNTLGIPKGQTMGLLGMNGAGKTTTISLLAGDIVPSSGEIKINGHDLITDRGQALCNTGMCPQFDALITLLSAREQLWLYCRIKGVPEEKINQVVEAFIKMMDLSAIANSSTGGYSGGNKRKTSLSIAMLGNPSIVYLDEPSTGCDPIVRRFQWNIINELGRDKAIIITSHSMAEVQALCSRLTIMKDGKFQCLGSVQHLRSKFGAGYSIDVKFKKEFLEGGINNVLVSFPTATVLDSHDLMASFELPNPPDNPIKVSQIFSILLNDLSSILEDYSVSQTSLDQIYIKLTGTPYQDRTNVLN